MGIDTAYVVNHKYAIVTAFMLFMKFYPFFFSCCRRTGTKEREKKRGGGRGGGGNGSRVLGFPFIRETHVQAASTF